MKLICYLLVLTFLVSCCDCPPVSERPAFAPSSSDGTSASVTTVDPVTAMQITAAVASIASFVFDFGHSSKQRRQLQDIIDYLAKIEKEILVIKAQNDEILKKLDELPFKIQSVLRTELKINELDNRYENLAALKKYFLVESEKTGKPKYYPRRATEYVNLYTDLSFISSQEYRIGYSVEILEYLDFGLLATDAKLREFVIALLKERIDYMNGILKALQDKTKQNAENIVTLVKNHPQYIRETNLLSFTKIDDFTLTTVADKPRMITRYGCRMECEWQVESPQNIAFNNAKHNFALKVNNDAQEQLSLLKDKIELEKFMSIFQNYLSIVESDK